MAPKRAVRIPSGTAAKMRWSSHVKLTQELLRKVLSKQSENSAYLAVRKIPHASWGAC